MGSQKSLRERMKHYKVELAEPESVGGTRQGNEYVIPLDGVKEKVRLVDSEGRPVFPESKEEAPLEDTSAITASDKPKETSKVVEAQQEPEYTATFNLGEAGSMECPLDRAYKSYNGILVLTGTRIGSRMRYHPPVVGETQSTKNFDLSIQKGGSAPTKFKNLVNLGTTRIGDLEVDIFLAVEQLARILQPKVSEEEQNGENWGSY